MKVHTKKTISNVLLYVMIAVVLVIAVWYVIFIVSTTFDLNVFKSRSTDFMITTVVSAFGIIICSTFLSIGLDISIISDAKVHEISGLVSDTTSSKRSVGRRVAAWSLVTVALIIALLFAGDAYSEHRSSIEMVRNGQDLVNQYSESIAKIEHAVVSGEFVEVPSVLEILSKQKRDLDRVSVVYPDTYDGQTVFVHATMQLDSADTGRKYLGNSFYQPSAEERDYFDLISKDRDTPPKLMRDGSSYKLFLPVSSDSRWFVLLCTDYKLYGGIGS